MAANRPELCLLIGLQGAGKSGFFTAQLAATHALVSQDLLRNHRNPKRRELELVAQALGRGQSVAVDDTHPAPERRQELLDLGRSLGAHLKGVLVDATVEACLSRNEARTGRAKVPKVAIFATKKRFVPPSLDEGYDELWWAHLDPDQARFELRPWDERPEPLLMLRPRKA